MANIRTLKNKFPIFNVLSIIKRYPIKDHPLMKIIIICFAFFGISLLNQLDAQSFLPIDFEVNGRQLKFAQAGGLRNPQFSSIDLDNDGRKDLFIFDRSGSKVLTFLNKGKNGEISYEYAPKFEANFPKMSGWALMVDYNKDGLEDLFTLPLNGISGITVFKTIREGNNIAFRQVKTPFFNALAIKIDNGFTNVYHALTDIPAITDVDKDGDIDVLTFDPEGGRIAWYNNEAIENKLSIDTFDMRLKDICFGKVYESMFSSELFLSKDSLICSNGTTQGERNPRHSGSTVTALDHGCDGDLDLMLGDISSNNIAFLTNNGSINNPWISAQTNVYPKEAPIDLPNFLASFLIDVNNDGIKDLIVAPNDVDGGYNKNHIWLYLNKGTECLPQFQLETKNFLIQDMISNGAKSSFTTIDINGDGLLDILGTGNGLFFTSNIKTNHLFYYKNIGTKTSPRFILENGDYLSLSSKIPFSTSLALTSGDIEQDGDQDLVIADGNGEVYLFENSGGNAKPVSFTNAIFPYMSILAGQQAKPQIYDVDGDGMNDLLFGKQNNDIVYFKNFGAKGVSAAFAAAPTVRNFGFVFKGSDFNLWNSSPKLFKDDKNEEFALIGFEDGRISLYKRKKNSTSDSLILIQSNYDNLYMGSKATLDFTDINQDGKADILVGNFRGGLTIYGTNISLKNSTATKEIETTILSIYPNPAQNTLMINHTSEVNYSIHNIMGMAIKSGNLQANESIDISSLTNGLYRITLKGQNYKESQNFIKL
jgi:hypothetical protein